APMRPIFGGERPDSPLIAHKICSIFGGERPDSPLIAHKICSDNLLKCRKKRRATRRIGFGRIPGIRRARGGPAFDSHARLIGAHRLDFLSATRPCSFAGGMFEMGNTVFPFSSRSLLISTALTVGVRIFTSDTLVLDGIESPPEPACSSSTFA